MGSGTLLPLLKPKGFLASLDTKFKYFLGGLVLALFYKLVRKNNKPGKLPPSPPSGLFNPFGHAKIAFSRLPSRQYTTLAKDLGESKLNILSKDQV